MLFVVLVSLCCLQATWACGSNSRPSPPPPPPPPVEEVGLDGPGTGEVPEDIIDGGAVVTGTVGVVVDAGTGGGLVVDPTTGEVSIMPVDVDHPEEPAVVVPPPNVRLVEGGNPMQGAVEVNVDGAWYKVCSRAWSDEDATVVCNELGYPGGGEALRNAYFAELPDVEYGLDRVNCVGSEATILDCDHLPRERVNQNKCVAGKEASVICNGAPINRLPMRLVGSEAGRAEGNLQIQIGEEWAKVCHNGWEKVEADIVCREMGYEGGIATKSNLFDASHPELHYVYDRVRCTGEEETIFACERAAEASDDCDDGDEAGVICTPQHHDIRLVGGMDESSGVVEIFIGDRYYNMCGSRFNQHTARVVCDQLQFTGDFQIDREASVAEAATASFYTFICDEESTDIIQCLKPLKGRECEGDIPAAVICNVQ